MTVETLDDARHEIARLQRLLSATEQSALLQAMRASAKELDVQRRAHEVNVIRRSTSWRLTWPLRLSVRLLRTGPRTAVRATRILAHDGVGAVAARTLRRLRVLRLRLLSPRGGAKPSAALSAVYEARARDAQREIARLQQIVDAAEQSAQLHATRGSGRDGEAPRRLPARQAALRRLKSLGVAAPLRASARLLRRPQAVALPSATPPTGATTPAALQTTRRMPLLGLRRGGAKSASVADVQEITVAAPAILAPRVLIIAELSLPQCAKYRVWQKQAHFTLLGVDCTVLDWRRTEACGSALQTHALVIFYRVPGYPGVLALIDEAKRLGVTSYWEADDLIFDMGHYLANRNLDTLEPALRRSVLAGVGLFRRAMLACDRTIASTGALASCMAAAGAGPTTVIENALDAETTAAAALARATPRPARDSVVVAYGSGSKAHDMDFAMAAPALAELLGQRPQVRLRIIGDLTLPAVLDSWSDRVDRLPATGYAAYLGLLGQADISLAPLEVSQFNEAKSNIKFIEAAMLGLPSVCSGRAEFRAAIIEGETGFIADTDAQWLAALLSLVDDAALRGRVGQAALAAVEARYAPQMVAEQQVAPLVAGLDARQIPSLRVLIVNVFFAPVSFGGATIVAEEMAARLHSRPDTEVAVFTSRGDDALQYTLRRYEHRGIPVISVQTPQQDVVSDFDNPEMGMVFADVLRAVQPDVVHFHSVQTLSASMLRSCTEAGVPYVVTVHDAWWLCARQFMVTEKNNYCFQTRIDVTVCEACVPGALHLRQRLQLLVQALSGAALVLSPSEAHRALYLANGLPPDRVLVNHNGIRMPSRPRQRQPGARVRFGYVGGISGLKGYHLIQAAFEAITSEDYELILVDNTLKLGWSSIDTTEWMVSGTIRTVPSYDQAGLDAFFDGLDVLLFPSQWKESFGLIVCEALARDVWVVVTEGGGAAEFVRHGENGTIIPLLNDPVPLQGAIEHLIEQRGRLASHVNPYKAMLNTYDAQAEELREMLARAAGGKVSAPVTRDRAA